MIRWAHLVKTFGCRNIQTEIQKVSFWQSQVTNWNSQALLHKLNFMTSVKMARFENWSKSWTLHLLMNLSYLKLNSRMAVLFGKLSTQKAPKCSKYALLRLFLTHKKWPVSHVNKPNVLKKQILMMRQRLSIKSSTLTKTANSISTISYKSLSATRVRSTQGALINHCWLLSEIWSTFTTQQSLAWTVRFLLFSLKPVLIAQRCTFWTQKQSHSQTREST